MDVPTKTAPRLFLIDAYALIYRSYFAFVGRPLTSSKGENTSAAWGVANFVFKILEELQPDYMAVVFDAGRSQREELFPDYKATRTKMPDDLAAGLPRISELLDAFNLETVRVEGYEADDVIGTLAIEAASRGVEAVIVSGDKDFHQLVGPGVHLLNPGRGGAAGVAAEWVDESNAIERLGVAPGSVVDYLALIGDSSDNVPGAPGIGPKTARALLSEFGSLDELLERASDVKGKRAREALEGHADQIRLSRELVTIRRDVPVGLDLEAARVRPPDPERLRPILVDLEFRSLLDRLASPETPGAGGTAELEVAVVDDIEALADVVDAIRRAGSVAISVFGERPRAVDGPLVGIALATDSGAGWYLPFGHRARGGLTLDMGLEDEVPSLPAPTAPELGALRDLLGDPSVTKIGHDLKEARLALELEGAEPAGLDFDVMVASYVLDPGRRQNDLEALSDDVLGLPIPPVKELVGVGKSEIPFAEVSVTDAAAFAVGRVDRIVRLVRSFRSGLEETGLDGLFRTLEMPLVHVLADMEKIGIAIDRDFFREMSVRVGRDLGAIQSEIFKVAGREFNLNSTPQLREVLFEDMGLPVIKRTKTGPSTDVSVLEELAEAGHALPRLLIEYRQLEKLRSTYLDALPRLINPRSERIHTSFNQAVAATGRLSSSEPNLQNIPIRTDLGREIRKGFVARPGWWLLGVDYSQIELRILAHFSQDEAFVRAFRERVDVHRQTAAVIFDVSIDDVTPDMRGRAKTINFATLYGQGDFSLARQLGISRTEAKEFIDEYFRRFAGVRAYLDAQVESARERGFVETLLGRRRPIPELRSRNWNIRAFGERVAQNTPIQGTAADLIKKAMIDVHADLGERGAEARLLLQVHDELLLEVPEGELDVVRDLVVERMENALELSVPLVAETGVGRSWYDCKG